jgi:hypothetical protein
MFCLQNLDLPTYDLYWLTEHRCGFSFGLPWGVEIYSSPCQDLLFAV